MAPTPARNDILQGTLALLVLKTLASQKRMHGYAITTHIQQVSDDLLRVEEGSLYPALHRMQQAGWLRAEWGVTEKNREARFYSLTAKGRRQLAAEQESWSRLVQGVGRVLLTRLVDLGREHGYHKLVLSAFPFNEAGMALYERLGFRTVGIYREQGRLDGRWVDTIVMEKLL